MNAPCISVEAVHDQLVGVSALWFTSAFELSVGNTISEALERFHDDLANALDSHAEGAAANGGDVEHFGAAVTAIMYRMSVAAEWAERVERLERERVKAAAP